MNMIETASKFRNRVWRGVTELATKANRQMRKSNVYRSAEYTLAAQHGPGARSLNGNRFAIDSLGDFSAHNQDTDRPSWARKLQLASVSKNECVGLAAMVDHCSEHDTDNAVLLRQLRQISDAVVGPRESAQDARAYMRRAALKLHPDKCKDLEGWRIPDIGYSNKMPADYKYEQAKWGAEGLYELHRSLDRLYANPHYRVALYAPTSEKGGDLTPKNAAAEYSLFSAIICFFVPEATILAGAGGALIAIWWFISMIGKYRAQRAEITCRELVPFKPKLFNGQSNEEAKCSDTMPV